MKIVLSIVVAIIIGGGILMYLDKKKLNEELEAIKAKKDKVVQFDSIRRVIESRIIDSLSMKFDGQDKKIKDLEHNYKRLLTKSDELEKKYNTISVSMPDL
jgi:uncharacterized protein HemX